MHHIHAIIAPDYEAATKFLAAHSAAFDYFEFAGVEGGICPCDKGQWIRQVEGAYKSQLLYLRQNIKSIRTKEKECGILQLLAEACGKGKDQLAYPHWIKEESIPVESRISEAFSHMDGKYQRHELMQDGIGLSDLYQIFKVLAERYGFYSFFYDTYEATPNARWALQRAREDWVQVEKRDEKVFLFDLHR